MMRREGLRQRRGTTGSRQPMRTTTKTETMCATHTYAQVALFHSIRKSVDLPLIRLIRKSLPRGGQDFKSYIQARVAAPPP